jgi:hypothetical protein
MLVVNDNLAVPRLLYSVFAFLTVLTSVPTQLWYVTILMYTLATYIRNEIIKALGIRNRDGIVVPMIALLDTGTTASIILI